MFTAKIKLFDDILVELTRFLQIHILKPCRFIVAVLQQCTRGCVVWGDELVAWGSWR